MHSVPFAGVPAAKHRKFSRLSLPLALAFASGAHGAYAGSIPADARLYRIEYGQLLLDLLQLALA